MKIVLTLLFCCNLTAYAQVRDSVNLQPEKTSTPNTLKSYVIPTVFITYGLISLGDNPIRNLDLSTKAELTEDHPRFAAHVDDYLIFSPLVAVYGFDMLGLKHKNTVMDQTAMILITTGLTTAIVTTFKNQTHRLRPDGSASNSFPSGHTATAFAAAEILNQEFRGTSPWIGYAGYTVATAAGLLRMYNNKHWASDVVAGAGFGLLSSKLTYLLYPKLKHIFNKPHQSLSFAPNYFNKQLGYSITFKMR